MPGLGQSLPQILGALNSLRGGGGAFAERWRELEAQAQQQKQLEIQNQRAQGQDDRAQQGLMLQADSAERARQGQAISGVNSIRQLLEDETLDSPEAYDTREAFALNTAPMMGIDPDFVKTLRPMPTVFQTRQAKKKLAEIEKAYTPPQLMELEQGSVFEVGSERLTIAQLRERAGVGALDPATGQARSVVPTAKPDVPNTSEEQHIADAIAIAEEQKGSPLTRAEKSQVRLKAMGEIDATRRDPRQPRAGGPTDYQQFNMGERLAATWAKTNAPVREMDRQLRIMRVGLKRFRGGDRNGGAQAVLVTFQKILDPTSVVRESEYARTAAGQSLINRLEGYAERLAAGGAGLTDAEMASMVKTSEDMLADMGNWQAGARGRIGRRADQFGIDHVEIFDDALTGDDAAPAEPAPRLPASANPFRRNNAPSR